MDKDKYQPTKEDAKRLVFIVRFLPDLQVSGRLDSDGRVFVKIIEGGDIPKELLN